HGTVDRQGGRPGACVVSGTGRRHGAGTNLVWSLRPVGKIASVVRTALGRQRNVQELLSAKERQAYRIQRRDFSRLSPFRSVRHEAVVSFRLWAFLHAI